MRQTEKHTKEQTKTELRYGESKYNCRDCENPDNCI